jgi:hypothetical protein
MELTEFGGCPKTQWQHACGQWIERAGVPCFFSAQQPFGFLQSVIAGKANGFV